MKQIFKFVFMFILLMAFTAQADLYTAENVEMSGEGSNPVEAKNNAITSGELKAFDQVMVGLIGANDEALVERPSDDEILALVRDISILEEKNTPTSYWGKMNVRFNETGIQNYLKKQKQPFVNKEPPVYWVLPVWTVGANHWTLEDENPLYQMLKTQKPLSSFFKMILPDGDLNEMIAAGKAIEAGRVNALQEMAEKYGAEKILVVEVKTSYNGHWTMVPLALEGSEDRFSEIVISDAENVEAGWQQLMRRMATKWQEQNLNTQKDEGVYYARINVPSLMEWGGLEKTFKRMKFLENLSMQGAMPKQILLSFSYTKSVSELEDEFDKVGWKWIQGSSNNLGTLERKEAHENAI